MGGSQCWVRALRILLAGQLLADERYEEGFDHFAAQSAIAKLDAAAERDLGLPQFFRGTSLAGLPEYASRAETVAADLELAPANQILSTR